MLVGESSQSNSAIPEPVQATPPIPAPGKSEASWFSLAGLFSVVRASRLVPETQKAELVTYDSGEVHVDLVRVSDPLVPALLPRRAVDARMSRILEAIISFTDIF